LAIAVGDGKSIFIREIGAIIDSNLGDGLGKCPVLALGHTPDASNYAFALKHLLTLI
jgi:hypothetical protein